MNRTIMTEHLWQSCITMHLSSTVIMKLVLMLSAALTAFYFYLFYFTNFSKEKTHFQLQVRPVNVPDIQKSKEKQDPSSVAEEFTNVDAYVRYVTSRLALKPVVGSVALKPQFGSVINDVHFQYSINPSFDGCQGVDLFIIVISAPANHVHRQVVRRTWGSRLNKNHPQQWSARFAFLIGLSNDPTLQNAIANESATHEDLIQVDVVDTYMNLTLKTVAMLNWSFHFCSNAEFILKCDDDVYLNVPHWITLINRLSLPSYSIYGSAVVNLKPTRPLDDSAVPLPVGADEKWAISWDLWPWSTYPTYVSGGCYLIGSHAIGPLLAAAQTTPYFPFEDLYLNGLCARKAGLQVLASDRMLGEIIVIVQDLLDEDRWLMKNYVAWLTSTPHEMIASHFANELYFSCGMGSNQDLRLDQFNWSRIFNNKSQHETKSKIF